MDPVARGPFSTSMAAPATIFESAGLSCSRDELLYRRDLTKADLSISCGICTHTATAAQYGWGWVVGVGDEGGCWGVWGVWVCVRVRVIALLLG